MRRLFPPASIALALLLTALLAQAQINGVPPSVTSLGPRNVITAPAPSVTSLGPNGFRGSVFGRPPFIPGQVRLGHNPRFGAGFGHHFRDHGRFWGNGFVGGGYASPYYVPYYVSPDYAMAYEGAPPDAAAPVTSIFERQPGPAYEAGRYGEHYLDSRETVRSNAPPSVPPQIAPEPAEPQPTTILIFRDGHTLEVKNYAIVGATLINLGGAPRKIALADLDVEATVRTNDDRGVTFALPSKK